MSKIPRIIPVLVFMTYSNTFVHTSAPNVSQPECVCTLKSAEAPQADRVPAEYGGGFEYSTYNDIYSYDTGMFTDSDTWVKHPVTQILDSLLKNYDRRLRPQYGKEPVKVNVTMNIDSIGPISEVAMNFRLDISFRQYWRDARLAFNYSEPVTVNSKFLDEIWQPDTYFPDSYESMRQTVMVPNILLRIHPDGKVLYSARVTVIAKCPMNLQYFPMDVQACSLMVECFGYTTKDLVLNWLETEDGKRPVEYNPKNLQLAQFKLINVVTKHYTLVFSTGQFSDLEVIFYLKRDLIYFIIQTYVPATLIVLLSWVNFYVNRHSVPARASLAITTVLTMITLMGSTNANLPRVSSIKALDIYFGICFLYVFGALVEFALVCYFNKPRYTAAAAKPAATTNAPAEPPVINTTIGIPWRGNQLQNGGLSTLSNPFVDSPGGPAGDGAAAANHTRHRLANNSAHSPPDSPMLETAPFLSINLGSNSAPLTQYGQPVSERPTRLAEGDARKYFGGGPPPANERSNKRASGAKRRKRQRGNCVTTPIDVSKIDLYSRIMFPLTYIMICIIYWMVYIGVTGLEAAQNSQEQEG